MLMMVTTMEKASPKNAKEAMQQVRKVKSWWYGDVYIWLCHFAHAYGTNQPVMNSMQKKKRF